MRKISQILQDQRLLLNLEVEEISRKTKIPKDLLLAIEVGKWQAFSSYAYLQGVVKKYINALGLDVNKTVSYLKREIRNQEVKFIRITDYQEKHSKVPANLYLYLILGSVLFFFLLQTLLSWQKPLLELKPIPSKVRIDQPLIVSGQTDRGVLLYLNDEQIYQNNQGQFHESLHFKQKGKRQITIKVIGVNGKEQFQQYTIEIIE